MSSISTTMANTQEKVGQRAVISDLIEGWKSVVQSRRRQGAVPPVEDFKPRISEAVYHLGYGNGVVTARWPDGRLQVRFQREARNRLVWPSHLHTVV